MTALRKPRNRRRARSEQGGGDGLDWRRWLAPVVRLAIPLTVAAVLGPLALEAARTHPYFAVREVILRHRGRVSEARLREAVAVPLGSNVWEVDPAAIEQRVRGLPWVRSVEARRVLPGAVIVKVREHRPTAIVAVAGSEPWLWYVAANGRMVAPVSATDGRDFPYVTGIDADDLRGDDAFGPRALRRALGVLRLAARAGDALGPISEVHVDRHRGITLMPTRPAVPVALGWGGFGAKMARLGKVLPFWAGHEHELAAVNCTFEDEVVVRRRLAANGARGDRQG